MDPLVPQYATLVANLTLAGFMAVMYTRFFIEASKQRAAETQERKEEAEQRAKESKLDNDKCRLCMEQHRQDYQDLLDKVLLRFEESIKFEQTVAHSLATSKRMDQIEELLARAGGGQADGSNRRRPDARDRKREAGQRDPGKAERGNPGAAEQVGAAVR